MKSVILVILISMSSSILMSQADTILNSFSINDQEGEVLINWTMRAGSTCQGIQIYRSTDSLNFKEVGDIAGLCGSPDVPVPYSFVDRRPAANQLNYYRLEMGQYGYTSTLSVFVLDLQGSESRVVPNPIKTAGALQFSNERSETTELSVMTVQGNLVYTAEGRTQFFSLPVQQLGQGMFIYQLRLGDQVFTGRFFID